MIRQIAVLMGGASVSNQKKILEGMIDAAKEADCNLFIFTCHINYREKEENIQGEYHIMKLPDFRHFDGVIVECGTIAHQPTMDYVLSVLKDSKIPAVSIDMEIPGTGYVGILNYEAQYGVVEHLIKKHGCRNICYVSGPSFSNSANERRRAFEDALRENHIGWDGGQIIEGLWDDESGRKAVDEYLSGRKCPEAFVCANDLTAMGVMQELQKRGYRVPEDVYVTGFDNDEWSGLCIPPLTSVDRNQYTVGREAVGILLGHCADRERIIVPSGIVLRESCGCRKGHGTDTGQIHAMYVHDKMNTQKAADIMKSMISDISGVDYPENLIKAIRKYIAQTGINEFYLCLCEKEKLFGIPQDDPDETVDIENINTDYTETIQIPLAYEGGSFKEHGPFYKGLVLPEIYRNRGGGNFYIVSPLYYQYVCYGYCIGGNSRGLLEERLYYTWIMNIGTAFENIRKQFLLKNAVERLNRIWMYDTLTHLYNRSGFFRFASQLLKDLKENRKEIFLLFLDIDGLKTVNDTQGHENGDLLISTMAEIIRKSVSEKELAMRYGGDEFVIMGEQDGGRMAGLADSLRKEMDLWNRQNDIFRLSASIGGASFAAEKVEDINGLVEQADKHMYEEKRGKKQH